MKKLFLSFLVLTGFYLSSIAQESSGLGLAERRALKEYQDKQFPEIQKGIKSAAGFDVALDVKWEQIAKVGEADKYKEDSYWDLTIFQPLTKALSSITADQMGKDALKAKLKKIVIMHDKATAPISNFPNGLKWDAGVLTINFTPYENGREDYLKERIDAIQKLIESKL
jgi:hypothetical protein